MGRIVYLLLLLLLMTGTASAEKLSIAAASDLKFAMEEMMASFRKTHPTARIEATYGSSGKFQTQIRQGAPYDLFFSADSAYPQELRQAGLVAGDLRPYGVGRIVLWSGSMNAAAMTLADLTDPRIRKIAIANPRHAPYGRRAEEALRAAGLWDRLQEKLVFGDNIAHTAQFVQTGNAQVGIIALSLALSPELAAKGGYFLIPERLHQPLEQAFIVTRQGGSKVVARQFADYMTTPPARAIMNRYGFTLPGESTESKRGGRP